MKKDAKMEVLKKMREKCKSEDHEKMIKPDHLQKVTVMADSKEGLKEGLSKAEEIMESRLGMLGEMDDVDDIEDLLEGKKKKKKDD